MNISLTMLVPSLPDGPLAALVDTSPLLPRIVLPFLVVIQVAFVVKFHYASGPLGK